MAWVAHSGFFVFKFILNLYGTKNSSSAIATYIRQNSNIFLSKQDIELFQNVAENRENWKKLTNDIYILQLKRKNHFGDFSANQLVVVVVVQWFGFVSCQNKTETWLSWRVYISKKTKSESCRESLFRVSSALKWTLNGEDSSSRSTNKKKKKADPAGTSCIAYKCFNRHYKGTPKIYHR